MKTKFPASIRTLTWIARILSIIVIGSLFIYIVTTLLPIIRGDSENVGGFSVMELSLMAGGIIGLGLAWKWEAAGGVIALIAFIALAFTKLNDQMSPLTLFPLNLNAILFLLAWILKLRFIKMKKTEEGSQ
jgi:hypothetical protein